MSKNLRTDATCALLSWSASAAVVLGCVIAAAHLAFFGTASLALDRVELVQSWPFFVGFALVIGGLLLHADSPARGAHDVVMMAAAGVLSGLSVAIAWFYFGFTGLGLESDNEVGALLGAYLASLVPLLLGIGGAIFLCRTREVTERLRLLWMTTASTVSIATTVVLIIVARLTFSVTE